MFWVFFFPFSFFLIFVWDMRKVKFKNVKQLYESENEVLKPKAWDFFFFSWFFCFLFSFVGSRIGDHG